MIKWKKLLCLGMAALMFVGLPGMTVPAEEETDRKVGYYNYEEDGVLYDKEKKFW